MTARALVAISIALAMPAAPAAAQPAAEDDIASRIISIPNPQAYRIDGVRSGARVRADSRVQGGHALRVPVAGRNEQAPWTVGVAVPINREVHAGDQLILAFWMRLEEGEDGATSATLPNNQVQLSASPYTRLFGEPVTIGREWQIHEIRGRADRDYAAGSLNVAFHLATGRQVIDIGPVFVLNMGPGTH